MSFKLTENTEMLPVDNTQQSDLTMLMATSEHLPIIEAILQEVREWLAANGIVQWVQPFTVEWIAERINANEFYLALYDGQFVGTLRLMWSDLLCWGEQPDDAGLRLGKHMLDWAEQHTLANHRRYLRLDWLAESQIMREYYQNAGFNRVWEVGIEAYGERLLLLEKPLDNERVRQ
jgi:hypothetical protein